MFTRNSTVEPKTIEPTQQASSPGLNAPRRPSPPTPPDGSSLSKSVIGKDLKIIGQGLKIVSQGTIQVDGEVEGDVRGSEVIIGDTGQVTGMVAAERVIVRGKISGVIKGVTVALQASSKVVGDIHHMSLAIEQGAEFDGRCKRPSNPSELNLDAPVQPGPPGAPIPLPRAG
ncbi:MAG: polymer-forming cytoskeletal protein [Hyphomicrobiaceae bacterium]|nr:polymer-forming cytoskeletal protein [Hyphomicrobiaceae bacterium]